LLDDGTALGALKLVMDIVVDRKIMGHRLSSRSKRGLLGGATRKRNKIRGLTCGFGDEGRIKCPSQTTRHYPATFADQRKSRQAGKRHCCCAHRDCLPIEVAIT
jgi:hypothetical protein